MKSTMSRILVILLVLLLIPATMLGEETQTTEQILLGGLEGNGC